MLYPPLAHYQCWTMSKYLQSPQMRRNNQHRPCCVYIHSIHHSWMGWHFHEIKNFWTLRIQPKYHVNPEAAPADMRITMATEAEWKNHCDLWKIQKNQYNLLINVGCALHTALDKAISDQFKTIQQIINRDFWICKAWETMDELIHKYSCATAIDISKINNMIKTFGTLTSQLKCFSSR